MHKNNLKKRIALWSIVSLLTVGSLLSIRNFEYQQTTQYKKKMNDAYMNKRYWDVFHYGELIQNVSQEAVDTSIKSMFEISLEHYRENASNKTELINPCCYYLWRNDQTKERIKETYFENSAWQKFRKQLNNDMHTRKYRILKGKGETFTYVELYEIIKDEEFRYKNVYKTSCYLYPLLFYAIASNSHARYYVNLTVTETAGKPDVGLLYSGRICSYALKKQINFLKEIAPKEIEEKYWREIRMALLDSIYWLDDSLRSTFHNTKTRDLTLEDQKEIKTINQNLYQGYQMLKEFPTFEQHAKEKEAEENIKKIINSY